MSGMQKFLNQELWLFECIKVIIVGQDSSLHFVTFRMTVICLKGVEGSRGVLNKI